MEQFQGIDPLTQRQFLERNNNGLISIVGLDNANIIKYFAELLRYFKATRRANDGERLRLVIVVQEHEEIQRVLTLLRQPQLQYFTVDLRAVTLGSRNYLCINQDVNPHRGHGNVGQVTRRCNDMRHRDDVASCPLYDENNHALELLAAPAAAQNIMDIETLCESGQEACICPYFAAREIAHNFADIVVTPYNYVKNDLPGTRDFYKGIFRDSILFFMNCERGLTLEFGRPGAPINYLRDRVRKYLRDFEKLHPRRMIFTTDSPDAICEEVRAYVGYEENYEVILPMRE